MTATRSHEERFEAARERLLNEIVHVRAVWDEYLALYAQSDRQRTMLNLTARWFFTLLQRVLMRETLIGITRLTEKTKSGRNLTLGTLLTDPALETRPDVHAEITAAIQAARVAATPISAHRNKLLAHLDHATAVGDASLPGLGKEQITSAIQLIERAFNVHNGRIRDAGMSFEMNSLGASQALLAIIEQSERWRKLQILREESDLGGGSTGGKS